MSAIAYYLEDEGIATTGISLVREHTAAMRPPRFLWVPFPLGRPLGQAHDPVLQHRVIGAALALLQAEAGPVLDDFEIDLPTLASDPSSDLATGWTCPVSFAGPASESSGLLAEVEAEITALAPWYASARQRRGRTTVGVQSLSVPEAAERLAHFALEGDLEAVQLPVGLSPPNALKLMSEDLKAYYLEAALAQPAADSTAADRWFWDDTAAARLIRAVAERCRSHERPSLRALGKAALVPRRAI